ncbi:MAG: FAD-binding oxidoreductase [Deltaproteobacteria bacterium]|nr:FAD-binding oxidoreductase [Deltaproteobacteria bacterium]
MNRSDFLAALRATLGPDGLSTDPSDLTHWGRDWTRSLAPDPLAVVWPRDTAEVAAVVRACAAAGTAIVPSGGRTGLAGGAVAAHGEVVLSLDRLRDIGPVDGLNRSVTVGAGVPNSVLQTALVPHGLWWPVDLASKGSATVGGNLATNAGGLRVLRYGHARNWVLGVQVVWASGEITQLGGALHKDNSGYALQQLLVGGEGTLGILTAATLALAPLPGPSEVALVGVRDLGAAVALFGALRQLPVVVNAFEALTDLCLEQVIAHTGMARPLQPCATYALFDVENPRGADLAEWLAGQAGLVQDAALATDRTQADKLWSYRERITESLQPRRPHKNDVSVPVSSMAGLAAEVAQWFATHRPGWQVALFGHVGDGNLHVNALAPSDLAQKDWRLACEQADQALYGLVAARGGSLSAEHGIGLLKKPYLSITRPAAELAAMRAVKRALDPGNLLNPGKIFDL